MKRLLTLILVMGFGLSTTTLFAGDYYMGAKKCGMCHKKKHEVHNKAMTAHPHMTTAFGKLNAEEQKNPECVVCHTTGFAKGGYEIKDEAFWTPAEDDSKGKKAVKRMKNLQMVGCESCHTDMTDKDNYMKHKKKDSGYVAYKPDENNCKTCHNPKSPTFKKINFAEEIKKLK
ncbi:MAG: hypothetical protein KAI81_01890 [Candidatus Marinimicrobia bacterium]|nr:hypothetical protein [Candidatus Neomarinimicrobiota bacterium]